jgi:DNA replication and repair protein RecF
MIVRALALRGFRSFGSAELELGPGPHVVVGPNAAGKTNLLESLVVISRGRSHRTSTDAELVAWGSDLARLEARVTGGPAPTGGAATSHELEVVIPARGSTQLPRKRTRVDGVARRSTALGTVLRTVVFAPEDMLLVVGQPSLRRAAIDELLVQREPLASGALSTYGRVLAQRNSLLRRIRDELASRDELAYWDEVLCREGGRLVAWRIQTLAALAGPLAEAQAEIAPDEPELTLRYVSNVQVMAQEDHEAALRRRLRETAEKELWNGTTLVGPHRDDVAFLLGGRDLAPFGSRGQQRTAILALKLAEMDVLTALDGRPPLLLLDDVFSELDPARRGHLVRRLDGLPQALVTTTTLADLDPELVAASTTWRVEPGQAVRDPQGLALRVPVGSGARQ